MKKVLEVISVIDSAIIRLVVEAIIAAQLKMELVVGYLPALCVVTAVAQVSVNTALQYP